MKQEIYADPFDFDDWDLTQQQPLLRPHRQLAGLAGDHRPAAADHAADGQAVRQGRAAVVRLLRRSAPGRGRARASSQSSRAWSAWARRKARRRCRRTKPASRRSQVVLTPKKTLGRRCAKGRFDTNLRSFKTSKLDNDLAEMRPAFHVTRRLCAGPAEPKTRSITGFELVAAIAEFMSSNIRREPTKTPCMR